MIYPPASLAGILWSTPAEIRPFEFLVWSLRVSRLKLVRSLPCSRTQTFDFRALHPWSGTLLIANQPGTYSCNVHSRLWCHIFVSASSFPVDVEVRLIVVSWVSTEVAYGRCALGHFDQMYTAGTVLGHKQLLGAPLFVHTAAQWGSALGWYTQ